MRVAAAVVAVVLAFAAGWTFRPMPAPQVDFQVVVRTVPLPTMRTAPTWAEALEWDTPVVDELVRWDEVERQTDCLWEFLKARDVEITLEAVLAASEWTDMLGGACEVMGR